MRESMPIGPTPYDEPCAQVGEQDYRKRNRIEMTAFTGQLIRQFGQPPGSARFKAVAFHHEFGTYHEVAVSYDDSNQEETDYAYNVENNTPAHWDERALEELRQQGYTMQVLPKDKPNSAGIRIA